MMPGVVLHVAFLVVLPPLFRRVIAKVKAWFAGRKGAPFWQPYCDLFTLVRKGAVYSHTTTWVFRAGPLVGLASVLAAGLVLPLTTARAPLTGPGDLIVFAYLLGLGRFFHHGGGRSTRARASRAWGQAARRPLRPSPSPPCSSRCSPSASTRARCR